jgi:hypothetical protein
VEDEDKVFSLAAYLGTAIEMMPAREFSPRTRLQQNVPPEETIQLVKKIQAPQESGVYELHFDLIEENFTWFVAQGSPEKPHLLVVESSDMR